MDQSTENTIPSAQDMTAQSTATRKIHKGKVCLFLLLVVLALVLLGMVASFLYFATPRTDPKIQSAPHNQSQLRLDPPTFKLT